MTLNSQKAAIFALLGRIFISELDRQSLEALQEQQISTVFEKLQKGSKDYLDNTQWDDETIDQLASEYCHLFILPKKPGLSLKASHWMTNDESSHLAKLETIISRLDLDASAVKLGFTNLPDDHLGVLLYFMSSIYGSDDEELQKLGASLAKLSLFPWILKFNDKLLISTTNPLYLASGKLLLELLSFEEQEG